MSAWWVLCVFCAAPRRQPQQKTPPRPNPPPPHPPPGAARPPTPPPTHMDHYLHTSADNGGVHTNSGIPNHAFYVASTTLGGNAWEAAGNIWYDALLDRKG